MREVTDQMGRKVALPEMPKRIISLVPSQTELLFDLGLEEQIVGLTRFCVHPSAKVAKKVRIGGTKDFDFGKIAALQPDLIIGNKEENYKEGIAALEMHYPLWMSEIYNISEACDMMRSVGEICGRAEAGAAIASSVALAMGRLSMKAAHRPACAYLIWRKPYIAAASGTFIDHMLQQMGLANAFAALNRYPEINEGSLRVAKPEFIFLSSEPYRFSQKHVPELEAICPGAKVVTVNGEMFSWYGSRLRLAAGYLAELRQALLPA